MTTIGSTQRFAPGANAPTIHATRHFTAGLMERSSDGPGAASPGGETSPRSSANAQALHRIVIVGGGAGGLELAVRLGEDLGRRQKAEIVLVDATLTHLWKPLLHEVAAGTLGLHENEIDFLQQARAHHFRFHLGRFETVDRAKREIWLAPLVDDEGLEIAPRRPLAYDTLVVSIGAIDNDFGTPGARAFAHSLNNAEEAERFHHRLLAQCAKADLGSGEPVRVVIVGGGATGVELAAELTNAGEEIAQYGARLQQLKEPLKITIVEAGPRLLGGLPEEVVTRAQRDLSDRGVTVLLGRRVTEVEAKGVVLDGGQRIDAELVVWAAGIQGQEMAKTLDGLEVNRQRQLVVLRTLQTTKDEHIFAFGDCASCQPANNAPRVPPTAQAARQQAISLARSLCRRIEGKPPIPFIYEPAGSLVSLGETDAVGSVPAGGKREFTIDGALARFTYWMLHRRHMALLLGPIRTALLTLGQWLSRRAHPRVKLH